MYLTQRKFIMRVKALNMPYWTEGLKKMYRWEYMKYCIDLMKDIGAVNTLEMGTNFIPLNSSSYLFELEKKYLVNKRGKVQDLNHTPYKIPNKHFDCATALQVWEHLDNQQSAFLELVRISKNVILSFPYMWNHGDKRHRGIDDEKIFEWTCGIEPDHIHKIKSRIIYLWRF